MTTDQLIVTVRYSGGTYHARIPSHLITATCTACPKQAAEAAARKIPGLGEFALEQVGWLTHNPPSPGIYHVVPVTKTTNPQ